MGTSTDPIRAPKLWLFLLLAYAISWSIAIIGISMGVTTARLIPYMVMAGSFMFGPAIAALVQQRLIDRSTWRGLALGLAGKWWKWVLYAALAGILIIPVCLFLVHVLGTIMGMASVGHVAVTQEQMLTALQERMRAAGRSGSPLDALLGDHHIPGVLLLTGLLLVAFVSAITVNLPAMLGEELGWRGYLYQATAAWAAPKRVLFTGVVWGLWHAPLIAVGHNYPGHPVLGIGLMVVFTVLLAFLFDWSRTRSGTVWSTCVLHGVINGSAGAFALFAWGGDPLVASPVGAVGFVAIALIGIAVLLLDHGYRAYFLRGVPVHPVLPVQ